MFDSAEEALPYAEEIPGPTTEAFERECARLGVHAICGLLERDGDTLYNAAILVGPDGPDRLVPEDAPAVPRRRPLRHAGRRAEGLRHAARPDRPDICYDLRFPEVTRTLALQGADIVAHADELPDGGEDPDRADHGRAGGGEPHLPPAARTASARSAGASSAAGARSSTRTASGWRRRARPRRRCSSPRSTSRRRATRTTWFPASTSSTSSATGGRSCTAPSSRRRRPSRPRRRIADGHDEELVPEALLEQGGRQGLEEPLGAATTRSAG